MRAPGLAAARLALSHSVGGLVGFCFAARRLTSASGDTAPRPAPLLLAARSISACLHALVLLAHLGHWLESFGSALVRPTRQVQHPCLEGQYLVSEFVSHQEEAELLALCDDPALRPTWSPWAGQSYGNATAQKTRWVRPRAESGGGGGGGWQFLELGVWAKPTL